MNAEKILKIINRIQTEIDEVKKELGYSEIIKEKNVAKKHFKKNKSVDLLPPIKKLYDDKFFIDNKSDLEVIEKLESDLLTDKSPKRASIVNVLRKMVKTGLLTREKTMKNKKNTFCYRNKS